MIQTTAVWNQSCEHWTVSKQPRMFQEEREREIDEREIYIYFVGSKGSSVHVFTRVVSHTLQPMHFPGPKRIISKAHRNSFPCFLFLRALHMNQLRVNVVPCPGKDSQSVRVIRAFFVPFRANGSLHGMKTCQCVPAINRICIDFAPYFLIAVRVFFVPFRANGCLGGMNSCQFVPPL